jgi:hypothetical protein
MGIIKDLWDVGQDLLGMSEKFKLADKQKKTSASALFNLIGDLLKDTHDKLENGIYPAGNCQQLLIYGNQIYDKTKEVIGDKEAKLISEKIVASYNVEQLFYELENSKISKKELVALDEVSGFFRATANLLLL